MVWLSCKKPGVLTMDYRCEHSAQTHARAYIPCTCAHTHACMHVHAHTHIHTHMQMHSQIHKYRHIHNCMYMHMHTQMCTYAYTHKQTTNMCITGDVLVEKRRQTINQYAEEKRWVFSFDIIRVKAEWILRQGSPKVHGLRCITLLWAKVLPRYIYIIEGTWTVFYYFVCI